MKKIILILLSLFIAFTLASCYSKQDTNDGNNSNIDTSDFILGETDTTTQNVDDEIANTEFTDIVNFSFSGTTYTVDKSIDGIEIINDNGNISINNTNDISKVFVQYVFSGTLKGSITIYGLKKFSIVLSGVSITATNGPCINVVSGKRVYVVVADDTVNNLTDATTYTAKTSVTDNSALDQKAAFFSEEQLIFSGKGTLNISANYKHGICSDDYIRITESTINILSAVTDGIHANDCFILDNGVVNIVASDDGVMVEDGAVFINGGTLTISSVGKGISCKKVSTTAYTLDNGNTVARGTLTINSGVINITKSFEGLESKGALIVNGGYITITASDDGINSTGSLTINGGYLYAYCSGGDAIDSNANITITGGTIVAIGAASPECGIDCDNSTFKIAGGTIVATGGTTSSPTASVCTQPGIVLGSLTGVLQITDNSGSALLTFAISKSFSTMLVSSSSLKQNATVNIYSGGSITGGTNFYGLTVGGTTSGTTLKQSTTLSSMITSLGGSSGMGGGGQFKPK